MLLVSLPSIPKLPFVGTYACTHTPQNVQAQSQLQKLAEACLAHRSNFNVPPHARTYRGLQVYSASAGLWQQL